MGYQYLDIPRYVAPEVYDRTVEKIVDFLKKEESILSIYKLGNVNHPGISDIDIVVLFKNGSSCKLNPADLLNLDDKYLLTHEIFGASEDQFRKVIHYSFWDNLNCIWGDRVELDTNKSKFTDEEITFYKTQIGLEFLVKNYIELSVQRKYGVIKLRSLIQEIKGIRYDLVFLNINRLKINECLMHFLNRLDHWFENTFDPKEFGQWLDQYYLALEEAIIHINNKGRILWVPREDELTFGRNITLDKGDQLQCKTSGFFLPSALISNNKKIYNAHQRLNDFNVILNYSTKDAGHLNGKRFKAFEAHKMENQQHYPHFGALMTSLAGQFI